MGNQVIFFKFCHLCYSTSQILKTSRTYQFSRPKALICSLVTLNYLGLFPQKLYGEEITFFLVYFNRIAIMQ